MYQHKKVFKFIILSGRTKSQKSFFTTFLSLKINTAIRGFLSCLIIFSALQVNAQDDNTTYDVHYGKILSGIVEKQIGLYEDERLEHLIDTVGQTLVHHLDEPVFEYSFKILDLKDPNAFSLPGGYIYVTRGLLALINSEDELAGVMSHEIIHSQKRHSYHQMKTGIFSALLQLPANIAGNYLGNDLGTILNAPFALGGDLLMSGYSKKNEREADIEGIRLAAASGYDPLAINQILEGIKTTTEIKTGKSERKDYLSNHPYTPKRLAYIKETATKLQAFKHHKIYGRDQFIDQFEGLAVGENPVKGVFIDHRFLHPEKKISISFPGSWQVSNVSKAVLGMAPDDEALVLLTLNAEKKEPKEQADEFLNTLRNKEVEILTEKPLKINQMPAYLITLRMMLEERMMYFQNLWIKNDSLTYNIIGTGTEKYLDDLKNISLSFSKADNETLSQIKVDVLEIVKAGEGESLETISKRVDGKWDTNYLEVINCLDKKEKLKNGQKIKVVVEKKYLLDE